MVEGVVEIGKCHFWELNQGHYIASIVVLAHNEADEQKLRLQISSIFKQISIREIIIQVDKDVMAGY